MLSKFVSRIAPQRLMSWGTPLRPLQARRSVAQAVQDVASKPTPSFLLNTPATEVTTLKNGMRVATENSRGETATVGVWIDAGTVYEDDKTNGVAHFLEHMAFKGTKTRAREALEKEVENMGAALNAYTSREQTVYYIKTFKNDLGKAVDILADILQNSTFDKDHIERERSTILREMEEVAAQPEETIFDHLHSIAFQGTSLGRTILGPAENVNSITRDDLLKYISTHYTAPRMVLAASGGVDHQELVKLADRAFSGLSSANNKPANFQHPGSFTGSMVTIRDDEMPEAHVTVAFESVGWSNPDFFTFMVLQSILGAWDKSLGGGKNLSSRMCEQIATHDLADSITTFNTCYHNTGLFGVYGVSSQVHQLDDMMYEFFNELQRLAFFATEAEVARHKNKLIANVMMQLDGTSPVCEEIGRQLLTLKRRVPAAEVWKRIDSITVADVKRVAKQYFYDVDPAVAAMGPLAYFPDYNMIRGWTVWNRL
jgi:processing peptidase subunit beta